MKKKYLLLYLKTGGGHIAAAKAIAKEIERRAEHRAEPVLVDGFAQTHRLVRTAVEGGYRQLQAKAKWAFEALYAFNKIGAVARFNDWLMSFFTQKHIKEQIEKHKPEKILIFHFFLSRPVLQALSELKLDTPVFTVVTDPFTTPRFWLLHKKQNYIVFSRQAKKFAVQKQKIPASQVHVFPLVLDAKFAVPPTGEAVRAQKKQFGFSPGKPLILIIGGGDGIPRGKKIVRELLKTSQNAEIAIVCGKNKRLMKQVEQLKKTYRAGNLQIYGFVGFVYELVSTADVVICKAGPATLMEILLLQKVPVVNSYIWEQEKGNVEFLTQNDLGIYEPRISKLSLWIKALIEQPELMQRYKQNIAQAALKNGTREVVEFIL